VATIDYALTVADADIVLAPPSYAVMTTIELTGAQRLVCDPLRTTTLSGQPSLGTYNATIQLRGIGSGIHNCVIRGEDENGYCIDVWLTAGNNEITGNTISDCGGAAIRFLANGATITDNLINSPSATHLFFQSTAARGTANGNTFAGTPVDNVACGLNSLISGTGNTGSQGCESDCNCPAGFFN
jgi:parallel beta-helix repeat protein